MTVFVLDCSVTMGWCFEDESSRYPDRVLDALKSARAIVPAIWSLEVANVLLVGERKKRLTEAGSSRFVALLQELPIALREDTVPRGLEAVLRLARGAGISAYDAAYLELAMREGVALATQDVSMKDAAKKLGIPLFKPEPS